MIPRGLIVVVATTALAVLTACGRGQAQEAIGGVPAKRLATATADLCTAQRQVGDRAVVRTTFYERPHPALHTVASSLESVDRPLAAQLLIAMQRVEADLDTGSDPNSLSSDLHSLIAATAAGVRRLDVAPPSCMTR